MKNDGNVETEIVGDESDRFFPRVRRFHDIIAASDFCEDFELSGGDIERLDFILNEFLFFSDDPLFELLREQSQQAGKLIKDATKLLNDAAKKLAAIEKNAYASSALIAVLPEIFGSGKSEETQIDALNQSIGNLHTLSKITSAACSKQPYSNGLPKFKRGAPEKQGVDRLLWRLIREVRRHPALSSGLD